MIFLESVIGKKLSVLFVSRFFRHHISLKTVHFVYVASLRTLRLRQDCQHIEFTFA